jgi:KDO2-lipid IV(A) lauroyltransferase
LWSRPKWAFSPAVRAEYEDQRMHRSADALSLRIAAAVLSRLSEGSVGVLARLGGSIHYVAARDKRRNYRYNTEKIALVDGAKPVFRRPFQNHARNVLELLRAFHIPAHELASTARIEGEQYLEAAMREGRGLVICTCHLGNWEISGLALAARGYPITTVAGVQLSPAWSESVKNLKRRFGMRIVSPGTGYRSLYRDLESNRIVVLHVDGNIFSSAMPVAFLGRTIRAPRGPARIARAMRSKITCGWSLRDADGRLRVIIDKPLSPPSDESEEERLMKHMVAVLEEKIVQNLEQWCIFRRM